MLVKGALRHICQWAGVYIGLDNDYSLFANEPLFNLLRPNDTYMRQ